MVPFILVIGTICLQTELWSIYLILHSFYNAFSELKYNYFDYTIINCYNNSITKKLVGEKIYVQFKRFISIVSWYSHGNISS